MCGVLFFYSKKFRLQSSVFSEALGLMTHRGPDSSQVMTRDEADRNRLVKVLSKEQINLESDLFVGHNRLAIFDPSDRGLQPFLTRNGSKFLSYNGEFYNFREYAESFQEKSDGRVLFQQLCLHSVRAYDNVNGMWASIFGNLEEGKIYLSRDRYGKKPLFYFFENSTFVVGSEPKALFHILRSVFLVGKERKVNPDGLARYLLGKLSPYDSHGINFYESIHSVSPGSNMLIDLNTGSLEKHSDVVWKELNQPNLQKLPKGNAELVEAIRSDLDDSIKLRLQADTKVAVMVSGGIDSSFIIGNAIKHLSANKLHLFTSHIFGTNKEVNDDLFLARRVAEDLDLKLNEVTTNDDNEATLVATIIELTKYAELPLNHLLSSIPTFQLTKSMAANGIKVCLDGVGGDEVFGGYPANMSMAIASAHHGSMISAIKHWLAFQQETSSTNLKGIIQFLRILKRASINRGKHIPMNESALESIKNIKNPIVRERAYALDKTFFVRGNLTTELQRQKFELFRYQIPYYLGVADSFSMANSVENRSPFLDYRLIKYLNIQPEQKTRGGYNKVSLRSAMPDNIASSVSWNKKKLGMGISFKSQTFSQKETLELVAASGFVREMVSIDTLKAGLENQQAFFKSMVSLAALDEVYGICI